MTDFEKSPLWDSIFETDNFKDININTFKDGGANSRITQYSYKTHGLLFFKNILFQMAEKILTVIKRKKFIYLHKLLVLRTLFLEADTKSYNLIKKVFFYKWYRMKNFKLFKVKNLLKKLKHYLKILIGLIQIQMNRIYKKK